jgi:hypothetical protein
MEQKKLNKKNRLLNYKKKTDNMFLHKYVYKATLKNRFYNIFMLNCQKHTIEKNMVLFLKSFYSSCLKNIKSMIKYSIINSSSIFGLKILKKNIKEIPFFLKKSLRQNLSIKNIKNLVLKNKKDFLFLALRSEISGIMKKSSSLLVNKQILLSEAIKKKTNAHFRWF